MTTMTTPSKNLFSPALYVRDIELLKEFLLWANAQGYAICQWESSPTGVHEYLTDVTEQAIEALPVQFANERSHPV